MVTRLTLAHGPAVGGGEKVMPSFRDGSVASCPNTGQLRFLWSQTPGGAEQRRPVGRVGARHGGGALGRAGGERGANGTLPWGHGALPGTHRHGALLISTPRSPETHVYCPLLQIAVVSPRHNHLPFGVGSSLEVPQLGPVPGASSGQPLGCIPRRRLKPPSIALLPSQRAGALQPRGRIQPGGRRCSGRRRSRHAAGSVTRLSSAQECRAAQRPASCCLLHASCPIPAPHHGPGLTGNPECCPTLPPWPPALSRWPRAGVSHNFTLFLPLWFVLPLDHRACFLSIGI